MALIREKIRQNQSILSAIAQQYRYRTAEMDSNLWAWNPNPWFSDFRSIRLEIPAISLMKMSTGNKCNTWKKVFQLALFFQIMAYVWRKQVCPSVISGQHPRFMQSWKAFPSLFMTKHYAACVVWYNLIQQLNCS